MNGAGWWWGGAGIGVGGGDVRQGKDRGWDRTGVGWEQVCCGVGVGQGGAGDTVLTDTPVNIYITFASSGMWSVTKFHVTFLKLNNPRKLHRLPPRAGFF